MATILPVLLSRPLTTLAYAPLFNRVIFYIITVRWECCLRLCSALRGFTGTFAMYVGTLLGDWDLMDYEKRLSGGLLLEVAPRNILCNSL